MNKLLFLSILGFVALNTLTAQVNEAETFFRNQQYDKAFEIYQECFDMDSSQLVCLEYSALSCMKLGDLARAKNQFLLLEKKDSLNFTAISQLAAIFEQERNIPKAVKYYLSLTRLYPENPVFHRKLAQQYQSGGLNNEAFQAYSRAHSLNPRDMYAIKGISEIFISNRQYSDADSILSIGLMLDSMNVQLNLLFAQSKYRQKRFDSTVYFLERVQYEIDFSPYHNKMMGYACIQIDSFEKSIHFLEKALNDDGSKEYAHYYLGIAYENMENMEYAIHHYNKAVEESISDNIHLYHQNLARIYKEDSDLKNAIQHYRDAIRYGGEDLLLFHLARASDSYFRDKNIAIRYYEKFLNSSNSEEELKAYAEKRLQLLKEQEHQKIE